MQPIERQIRIQLLTKEAFSRYGDVIALKSRPDYMINQGFCGRHHDLANMDFAEGGQVGISLFDAEPRSLPYKLNMMERHPKGSQAFVPMQESPFLVIVAPDDDGHPDHPEAFLTKSQTGVNIHKNIWHGVLTPLSMPGLFAVIDRIGNDTNLEEFWFDQHYIIIE